MREAHAHLGVTEEHFAVVADYLERALRANGVGDDNVEVVMSEVAALKDPIIGA